VTVFSQFRHIVDTKSYLGSRGGGEFFFFKFNSILNVLDVRTNSGWSCKWHGSNVRAVAEGLANVTRVGMFASDNVNYT
jgi:hypothetical protein